MADENAPSKPKSIHRLQIGLNLIVQVAIIIVLAAMVNYLGFEHYKRWDLSRDKKYALSDKTKHFLDSIKGKVRITVFFGSQNPITADVQNLLTEYQYASRGKIDVEYVDPDRNLTRAKELFDKYKVVTDESVLIVDYQGRTKTVKSSEMADMDQGNPMTGEPAQVTAFKGEQAITSALIDIVEGKKNTVGYIVGHKEPPLAGESPISVLKTFIENENIKFQELNLFELPAIPKDVKVVMIDGPQYDFSDREMKILRDFWNKDGRILLLIDPAAKTPKLLAFLNELGVKVDDDRLMAMVKTGIEEVARVRDVMAHFMPDNPVTKRLADVRALFFGPTSSLTLDSQRVVPRTFISRRSSRRRKVTGARPIIIRMTRRCCNTIRRKTRANPSRSRPRSRKAGARMCVSRSTLRASSWSPIPLLSRTTRSPRTSRGSTSFLPALTGSSAANK